MPTKTDRMAKRIRIDTLQVKFPNSSCRTSEKNIPPAAEPAVTIPIASPNLIRNQCVTTLRAIVVGRAVITMVSVKQGGKYDSLMHIIRSNGERKLYVAAEGKAKQEAVA
jgi:hypothetical protein